MDIISDALLRAKTNESTILLRDLRLVRDSLGQRSVIDSCIVAAEVFCSVLDVRVKRSAELSINHHLVVCNLHLEKPTGSTQTCRARRPYQIKCQALADKNVFRTFADNVSSLFWELPECTAEEEWRLFKTAVASSTTRVCGWKRLGVANNCKKITTCWIEEAKGAIQAKKVACKAWLQNKADSVAFAVRWSAKVGSPHGEKAQNKISGEFRALAGFQLLPNPPRLGGKKSHAARFIKDQNGALYVLGRWEMISMFFKT